MAFAPLGDFLSRFKKLGLPNETIRKMAIEVIYNICAVNVSLEDVSYRDGVVYIKLSGAPKSEIYINKQKILKELENKIGNNKITDVR